MTPLPATPRDAFAQLCRDLAAEQRHARPERTRRELEAGPASAAAIAELVNAINPPARHRAPLVVVDGRMTA